MKIAVTGAMGMLGIDMVSELIHRGHDVVALCHRDTAWRDQKPGRPECGQASRQLDITDLEEVRQSIASIRPDAVVNCAAYTRVDDAEVDKDAAFAVNALGSRNLAFACRETRSALLHVSTDYVFSGDRNGSYSIWDPPCPINVYGTSKLWGENYVRSLMGEYYIVRTSWLFGTHGRNFVQTMLELGKRHIDHITRGGEGHVPDGDHVLKVVSDQHGSPTYTVDLARACADLLESRCFGIYHVTNQGVTTWYDFAKSIFEKAGLTIGLRAVTSEEFPRPARRPRNSALDPFPFRETIGYLLPTWDDALGRYLDQIKVARGTAGDGEAGPSKRSALSNPAGSPIDHTKHVL